MPILGERDLAALHDFRKIARRFHGFPSKLGTTHPQANCPVLDAATVGSDPISYDPDTGLMRVTRPSGRSPTRVPSASRGNPWRQNTIRKG